MSIGSDEGHIVSNVSLLVPKPQKRCFEYALVEISNNVFLPISWNDLSDGKKSHRRFQRNPVQSSEGSPDQNCLGCLRESCLGFHRGILPREESLEGKLFLQDSGWNPVKGCRGESCLEFQREILSRIPERIPIQVSREESCLGFQREPLSRISKSIPVQVSKEESCF